MKKGLHVFCLVIFLVILLALSGFAVYNFILLKPHVHYSSSADPIVEILPDCVNDGSQHKVCDGCGEAYDVVTLSALGHDLASAVKGNEKSPDCVKTGSYDLRSDCTRCDYFEIETKTVSALGHKLSSPVKENEVLPGCLIDGSYEMNTYCTECDYCDSESFTLPAQGHKMAEEPTTENYVAASCTTPGSYDSVTCCTECGEELIRNSKYIPKFGHDFEFEIALTEEGEMFIQGECITEGCGHTFDPEVDKGYYYTIEKDEAQSYAPTCMKGLDVFVAKVFYKGKLVDDTATYAVAVGVADNHLLNNENILDYAQRDESGRIYYNYSTIGINVMFDSASGENHKNVWDADGFAEGVFKCSRCGNWIVVRIFNDTAVKS